MGAEQKITATDAQAMLDRDDLTRVSKVLGGKVLLSEQYRRKLRKIIKRGQAKKPMPLAQVKKARKGENKPTQFEGTFTQRQRRRKVFELRLRNYNITEISEELNADYKTIVRDLQEIDTALQREIEPIHATEIINETLADYEIVKLIALDSLNDAEGNERAGLLNAITRANEARTALLQDAGKLPKATQTHRHTGPDGGPLPATNVLIAPVVKVTMQQTDETKKIAAQYHVKSREG